MKRRELLQWAVTAAIGGTFLRSSETVSGPSLPATGRSMQLRLHSRAAELAPGVEVRSIACNRQSIGPWIAASRSERIDMAVINHTGAAVVVRSPGLAQDVRLGSGNSVETAYRSNSLFDCLASSTGPDFGAITGIAAVVAPCNVAHGWDQEYFLPIHHWLPSRTAHSGALLGPGRTFRHATLGERLLYASEPIRVREGQRVLFHFYHAGAAKGVTLCLPRHVFQVVALDGYPVPRPRTVDHLFLGPGERVQTLVHMTNPGRWVMGAGDREHRNAGFGVVIEYPHARGVAREAELHRSTWQYGWFAQPGRAASSGATRRELVFRRLDLPPASIVPRILDVEPGVRYLLAVINRAERHCIALRGHPVELVSVAGVRMRGLVKDTVALPAFAAVEVEFVAGARQIEVLHGAHVTTSA